MGCDFGEGRRLGGDDHQVLRAEIARIGRGRRTRGDAASFGIHDGEAMRADRREVGPACDHRNSVTGTDIDAGDQPADDAGTIDADFHRSFSG